MGKKILVSDNFYRVLKKAQLNAEEETKRWIPLSQIKMVDIKINTNRIKKNVIFKY